MSDFGEHEIKNLIWSARMKATQSRVDVVYALSQEIQPVSVAALYENLKKILALEYQAESKVVPAEPGPATIYRTLETLVDAGIVHKIDVGKDRSHYELAVGRTHHHHAICSDCGLVEDIPSCQAQSLHIQAHQYLEKFSFINKHSLEFFGVCKKCAKTATNVQNI